MSTRPKQAIRNDTLQAFRPRYRMYANIAGLQQVLKKTSTLPLENVSYYTKKGCLETYQTKSNKYWLT